MKIFNVSLVVLSLALGLGRPGGAEEAPVDPAGLESAEFNEESGPAEAIGVRPAPWIPRFGQAADPVKGPPPPPGPFEVRRQRTDGPWLGVTERELADGHLVEVHANGSARVLGQEVVARPGGRAVYRYHSGRPNAPRSGADPAQEERNREDLRIIYGRGRN